MDTPPQGFQNHEGLARCLAQSTARCSAKFHLVRRYAIISRGRSHPSDSQPVVYSLQPDRRDRALISSMDCSTPASQPPKELRRNNLNNHGPGRSCLRYRSMNKPGSPFDISGRTALSPIVQVISARALSGKDNALPLLSVHRVKRPSFFGIEIEAHAVLAQYNISAIES